MKSFFIEGYGCSLNQSETQRIIGFLLENGFARASDFKKADFVMINTCSVKQATEQRMVSRIKFLLAKKKKSAKLIVTGCLAAAKAEMVSNINKEVIVLDTSLSSLCGVLNIKPREFSPELIPVKSNELISIIPASVGCLGSCTYCSARLARKNLKSYPVESILLALKNALSGDKYNQPSKEIWLTAQDLGCYGFDINSSLPKLLESLLKVTGNYRLRLGMMNPNHFVKIKGDLMPFFLDSRVYKFLHLPVQSGSNKILKSMGRKYSVSDFLKCVNYARKFFPSITIATDVIVGFPGETKKDFQLTMDLLKKVRPDIVNISRYGKRGGTLAEKMPMQVDELEKKCRSRELTDFCDDLFKDKNNKFFGCEINCLVSERTKNGFNARTDEYLTIFVKSGFSKFVKARIVGVKKHYLIGEVAKV